MRLDKGAVRVLVPEFLNKIVNFVAARSLTENGEVNEEGFFGNLIPMLKFV